jgi:hypothetical protein
MKALFRKFLLGDAAIKEYATVGIDGSIREKVYLRCGEDEPLDISLSHWVLCLDPLVFGVWLEKDQYNPDGKQYPLDGKASCSMYFRDEPLRPGGELDRGALASLQLDPVDKIGEEKGSLFLFRLSAAKIRHISFFKTRLIYSKFYKKPGLTFFKLKTFVAAYSYPRRVRIISFREEGYFNIFPMDLLGDIPQAGRFVFGLRHTNTALARIIAAKKIVVSEAPFAQKDTIYKLGSHHSASPPSIGELPFGVIPSSQFGFWVPEWVESYKEIKILRTIDLGSHMLMWGEPVGETRIRPDTPHLYHIHFLLYLQQKAKGFSYPLV